MICRFCGKKTESVLECPHCSHKTPVLLSYRSYSSDSIIDKLRSVLLSPPQKDETSSASSHDSVVLDAESALQMLQSDSAAKKNTEDSIQPMAEINHGKEETESNHTDDRPTSEYSDSFSDIPPNTSEVSKPDHNDDAPKQEDESIKADFDVYKKDVAKTIEPSVYITQMRLLAQKHILLICSILVFISLVIGFAVGYSVGTRNDNNSIPTESETKPVATFTTTVYEQTTEISNETFSTAANTDVNTITNAINDCTIATESFADMISDYGVRDGVLREKESEEIQ